MPTVDTVTYGAGAFGCIANRVREADGRRVIAIIAGSLSGGRVEQELRKRLGPRLAATYVSSTPHLPRSSVLEAAARAREVKATCVVSVGGGTPIDCGKGVALALAAGIEGDDDFDRHRAQFNDSNGVGAPPLNGDVIPHVAVPTTLSGGAHTALCGITNPDSHTTDMYREPALQPRAVILDPRITRDTPARIWSASGMRAVDHAIEGILSTQHTAMNDALASAALRLINRNLARSATHPADEAARTDSLIGTWMSAFALSNVGTGLSSAVGHQLGAEFDMLHGVTSAIMLPLVMEFTKTVTASRLRLVAQAMDVDTTTLDDTAAADRAIAAIRHLVTTVELPNSISAAGGNSNKFEEIANHVMGDPSVATCPRPVTRSDVLELLHEAW